MAIGKLVLAAFFVVTISTSALSKAPKSNIGCAPLGYSRAMMDTLKAGGWSIADTATRNQFALEIIKCLNHPDPAIRDGLAFEGFQNILRKSELSETTLLALQDRLTALLAAPDKNGFGHPFAMLALAEVARADRVRPFLAEDRRQRLITAGTSYLMALRDYRGFDAKAGWRHGIAHSSDLLLQLTLNPALNRSDLVRVRDAIGSQIAPTGHAYVYGESERLAAPILYMARRQEFSEAEWSAWLLQVASPAPASSWEGAFASNSLLIKRHNTTAFLSALYLNANLNSDTKDNILLRGIEGALRTLP